MATTIRSQRERLAVVWHWGAMFVLALGAVTVVAPPASARIETGDLTVVNAFDGSQQRYAALAHNPERDEYLLAYQRTVLGGIVQTVVARVGPDGSVLSGPTVIDDEAVSTAPYARPNVAYNPAADEFLVVSVGDGLFHHKEVRGTVVSNMGAPGVSAVLHGSLGDSPFCQARFPDVAADAATGGYKVLYSHFFDTAPSEQNCRDLSSNQSAPVLATVGADLTLGSDVVMAALANPGPHGAQLAANPATGTFMVLGLQESTNDGGFRIHASDLSEVGSGSVDRQPDLEGVFSDYLVAADPSSGNWMIASAASDANRVYTDLLSSAGLTLRPTSASDADGRPHSLAANGDGTFLVGTTSGRILQLSSAGVQLFRADDFGNAANRFPAVGSKADGAGSIAVGVHPTENTFAALSLDVFAPGAEPVVPARLLDTRKGVGNTTVDGEFEGLGTRVAGSVLRLDVAGRGGVPNNASAAMLNIAAAKAESNGFVTAYPCDADRPNTSNLNFATGSAASAAAVAKLSVDGLVCLFASTGIELIVDINGFVPNDRTVEPIVPARLMDSRTGAGSMTADGEFEGIGRVGVGSVTQLVVAGRGGVPGDADAALVNITAARPSAQTFVTAFPCGADQPNAASLNAAEGSFVNNLVLAKIGDGGKVCLFSNSETDLIVDVNAYVPRGGGLLSLIPARLLETREGLTTIDDVGAGGGPIPSGPPRIVQVSGRGGVPENATGAMVNAGAIRPSFAGFMTIYPCNEQRPTAANLNFGSGAVVSNAVFVKLDPVGKLCIYTSAPSNATIDVVGYTVDT